MHNLICTTLFLCEKLRRAALLRELNQFLNREIVKFQFFCFNIFFVFDFFCAEYAARVYCASTRIELVTVSISAVTRQTLYIFQPDGITILFSALRAAYLVQFQKLHAALPPCLRRFISFFIQLLTFYSIKQR